MDRLEYTILYLLAKAKEKKIDNLSKFQIMKLIYLLEVEAYKFTGKSFFGDISFHRYDRGPISVSIYVALENLESKNYVKMKSTQKPDYIHLRHSYFIEKIPKRIKLEDSEKMFLNSVFGSYIDLTQTKLGRITYSTEPMKRILQKEKKAKVKILKGELLDLNVIPLDKELIESF